MNLQVTKTQKVKTQLLRFKKSCLSSAHLLILILLGAYMANAQDETSIADNFSVNLELKNMHLWHGFVVTPGIMMASSIEYVSNNKKFIAGLWGGASYSGEYKEFSYYTKYNFTNNFNASLISHNNYSNYENYDIFSYNKYTSPNFVDVVFEYTVSENIPLTFYWSTILFGNGADFEVEDDGSDTNSYSNYVEMRYKLFPQNETSITLFAGGAFSFTTEKTFYSESTNIVNLGLTVSHDVEFLSKKFPVTGTAFWNPESGKGALQLAIAIF
ncbi:hypothetical protein [uncultured Draconibacterium sp.]|uniref:hypothetical protein n=1 Tax=uncultured Draconibacterium sp. TaxID=1573823 RepID=UPI0025E5791E|nr:hypothetical protein [uncultured Draconibacterium sp.]